MSQGSTLPPEIIEAIIEELAGDHSTLLAVCLTCAALRGISQRLLFGSTIVLDALDAPTSKAESLHQTFCAMPSLRNLVTSLTIRTYGATPCGAPLISILDTLPQLRKLRIKARNPGRSEDSNDVWEVLQDDLRGRLTTLMGQRSVIHVVVDCVQLFPFDLLRAFSQLKCVEYRTSPLDGSHPWACVSPIPLSIRQLEATPHMHLASMNIDYFGFDLLQNLNEPTSPLSLTHLRSLTATTSQIFTSSLSTIQDTIDSAADTLQYLSIQFLWGSYRSWSLTPEAVLHLQNVKNLTFLWLRFHITHSAEMVDPLIRTVDTITHGRNIKLEIYIHYSNHFVDHPTDAAHWKILDSKLLQMMDDAVLQQVNIVLSVDPKDDTKDAQKLSKVRALMSGLDSRNSLRIVSSTMEQ